MERSLMQLARTALAGATLVGSAAAFAQAPAPKNCAILYLHGSGAASSLASLQRKVQPLCAGRSPEMPWSAKRSGEPAAAALDEIGRHVKSLRREGYTKVVIVGSGLGANAAIAFAGLNGDTDGVIALGGEAGANPQGWGALPAIAPRMKQHIPLLWVAGSTDTQELQGEDFAFAKAPPHPYSRFIKFKADLKQSPDAAAGAVTEWLKAIE